MPEAVAKTTLRTESQAARAQAARRAIRVFPSTREFKRVLEAESGRQIDIALIRQWKVKGVGQTWVPWVARVSRVSLNSLSPEAYPRWIKFEIPPRKTKIIQPD